MSTITSVTSNGSFKTGEGTFHVSKPYRSKSSKKLRALITFSPRKSAFDINNEKSTSNEFRGFFSLFWISLFIFTVNTYVRSIETSGRPLNLQFFALFSQDAVTLALSDAVLVLSTGICVPFAIALKNGWIRYYWTGVVLQHIIQTTILFSAITWTFNRKWPWVQSGFLTLHSLVMIMKMHSYITVNGQLQQVTKQSQHLVDQMRRATDSVGGWDAAVSLAKERLQDQNRESSASLSNTQSSQGSTPGVGTPQVPEGSSVSYIDATSAMTLRRRLAAVAAQDNNSASQNETRNGTIDHSKVDRTPEEPHILVHHPNAQIAELAQDYSDAQNELISTGPLRVAWPNNIGWKNFVVYQLIPTLVYELEYPRTDRIRPLYIFEKTVATFGTFVLLYSVTETFILPNAHTNQSFLRNLLELALPFMLAYILLFYIIFECICNAFAELSYFADRQFYEDWSVPHLWNSTSWDEFSRKWNKPVHAFLLRHVYAASIMSYKLSRTSAMFFTFLLSACAHELVMVVVTQKFRFYLFALQLIQIPLITIGRMPAIKQNKGLGNVVFWVGLFAGFPLLCVAYVAY